MKRNLILLALCLLAKTAQGQSSSSSWIDVTVPPYSAKNDCSTDAGGKINLAIDAVPSAQSGVVFFPAGCYLIGTQVVDHNYAAAGITFLGFGRVEFRAYKAEPPTNSMMQFGLDDTNTIQRRKIVNIFFNCNSAMVDGIDIYNLVDSEFDDVDIVGCHGTEVRPSWHLRTVGASAGRSYSNYSNVYIGGVIDADGPYENGVSLGTNSVAANANAWSFFGTKILGNPTYQTGTGLDFEGAAGGFYGGVVSEWAIGIAVAGNSPASSGQIGGFHISGSYIEDNAYYGIRLGNAGSAGSKAVGVTIDGNYINCNNRGQYGVEVEQASGYSILSNYFVECTSAAIRGLADGTNQGADNGFVGPNFISGGQPASLSGSGNTVTTSFSTQSAAYTLTGSDTWVNVTGSTTVTVPHALTGQRWDVFNSGSATVTLACDSGTINGASALSLAANTGRSVTADGTNCFAH